MTLTEESTVAEHLQALAEAEPEKFRYEKGMFGFNFPQWGKADWRVPSELTQDDWDSILAEIKMECDVYRFSPTDFAATVRSLPVTEESSHFNLPNVYPNRLEAKTAGGCAAIRKHIEGKQ